MEIIFADIDRGFLDVMDKYGENPVLLITGLTYKSCINALALFFLLLIYVYRLRLTHEG